jgi:parallel beta-helix repeat protein
LALLGSLVHVQKGEAETYYVATNGSDANPGTEARPFQTLGRGVRGLGPGDTLYVKNGTYNGGELAYSTLSGASWDNPVTIAAYPGHSPAIGYLYFDRSSYVVLDGFVIDGVKITAGGGIASHIRIQNSEISPAGIYVTEGSDGNEFINLQVHDTAGHGIYTGSNDNIIEDCSIHRNTGLGVHAWHSTGTGVNSNTVRNNTVYNNGQGGILLSTGSGNQASNNDIWGNSGAGIRIDYGASNTYIGHNTIYENTSEGIYIGVSASNTLIESNNVYNNGHPPIVDSGVSTNILP